MDIIIRNGVIQGNESKKLNEIKNSSGLLKKDYKNYLKGIPGPYYDFFDYHLCIPRKHYYIQNFSGPQDKKKIKLIDTKDFNENIKYCCICHCKMKENTAFSKKRKVFIEEDIFSRKVEINLYLEEKFKKIKISDQNQSEDSTLDIIMTKLNKTSIDISPKWKILYNKINKKLRKDNINVIFRNYESTKKKIINKYYEIVYKLTKTPILYPISTKETKVIWPWKLTNYQKFKINNPNYKSSVIFNNNNNNITENYIMIE